MTRHAVDVSPIPTPQNLNVWIGANDVATEGDWRWSDGKELLLYDMYRQNLKTQQHCEVLLQHPLFPQNLDETAVRGGCDGCFHQLNN